MSARLCKLCLPAADNTGNCGLVYLKAVFIVSARLNIYYSAFAPVVIIQSIEKFLRRKMYIDILAAGNGCRCPPPICKKIGCNGCGKVTGVREYGDGTLYQGFLRFVAAKRAADPHLIPSISYAEAVAAEYINAVCLADCPYNPCIVDRYLFSKDYYFF